MKLITNLLIFCCLTGLFAENKTTNESVKNMKIQLKSISEEYLKKNLEKTLPRLIFNAEIEKNLKEKLKSDPVLKNLYKAVKLNAIKIQTTPLLKRKKTGRRLLSISRKMLYRINILCMVYRVEKDPKILQRINDELLAVCNFSDWNPSHFLDVAEMAMAVALAIDWTAGDLPKETIDLAYSALIEKALKPSWQENHWWIKTNNNWNQVCHGGMIAASLAIAEREPQLAAKTIRRALKNIPLALASYAPDGIYPEGASYWVYGTTYTVLTIAMLRSALGSDFGISKSPGFIKSAIFKKIVCAPSGGFYNFADCSDRRGLKGDTTLAWFAAETGNKAFFEQKRFMLPPQDMRKLGRTDAIALIWISQYKESEDKELPLIWKGAGTNPIVIFRGKKSNPRKFYFAAKGGKATLNHGNMDAGSFVFELDGIRWVIDPGNQSYYDLEKNGFKLWDNKQDSERWELLTKNNFGHSTITINNQLHKVNGMGKIIHFKSGKKPETIIDITPVFKGLIAKAERKFIKESSSSLIIEDDLKLTENTKLITWQLLTTAKVTITKDGAILEKNGKKLKLDNISHPEIAFSIIPLSPPPHKFDRNIKDLKRIELKIPAKICKNNQTKIKIRLSSF